MAKIKIIELLKSLSADEMKLLNKFIHSPAHNKHTKVIELFDYLRRAIDKPADEIYGENLFKTVFPGETVDMSKFHHVSSYLFKAVEDFLAWQEWKQKPLDMGMNLTLALRKHKLTNHFQKSIASLREMNLDQPLRDAGFYQINYQLNLEEFKHANTLGRIKELNLQNLADAHDIAYIIEKLRNASLLLSHQAVAKTEYDLGLLPHLLTFLEGHRFLEIPAVSVYYHAYMAMSQPDEERSFAILKSSLSSQSTIFDLEELKGLFIIAINFCIKKLNTDHLQYRREVFEIYQNGLHLGIFFNNEEFSPWTYSNIVQVGLMLEEFGVIENFIKKYKDYLPENKREAYFSYNYAWFFYQKKDYNNAMPLLLKTDYGGDALIACTAKTLLARMYHELGEFELLLNLLNTFRMFLRRNKILGYHRELYLNFIQFTLRLSTADKQTKALLLQEIKETKVVAAKDWLMEQVQRG